MAVGEELEHLERQGGTALAQVDLDGVVVPVITLACGDEIDAEAAQRAGAAQHLADAPTRLLQGVPVAFIGWKSAAQKHLAAVAAKQLVVRGDDLEYSRRCDAHLHRR